MDLLNHLDTIVVNIAKTLYKSVSIDVANLLPARLDQLADSSQAISSVRTLLTQISFVVSALLAAVLVVGIVKKRGLEHAVPPEADLAFGATNQPTVEHVPGALRGRWTEILGHLDSPRENDWKQAVVEADKLVDTGLMRAGFPGDSFGDRLSNIQVGTLVSLDGIWWAHKLRNRVAHELDYFLRYTEARQAISYYQSALEELKLI